jgi:hypothetical protein
MASSKVSNFSQTESNGKCSLGGLEYVASPLEKTKAAFSVCSKKSDCEALKL